MIAKSLHRAKNSFTQSARCLRQKYTRPICSGQYFGTFNPCHSFDPLIVRNRLDDNRRRMWSSIPLSNQAKTTVKSVEEQYSKKTPLEHVLLRPGMYVGPVERLPPNDVWVLEPLPPPYNFSSQQESHSSTDEISYRMVHKECGLVPALIKIFDEILVNASDNRLRNPKSCTLLDVRIDPGGHDREPCIRIWNNGKGIPVQVSFVLM